MSHWQSTISCTGSRTRTSLGFSAIEIHWKIRSSHRFDGGISVVKMNILPRVNFYSSMIPLPPPAGYWKKLDSVISQYIWNGKRPRIKLSTLLRNRSDGGWSFPNFKLYADSFTLSALSACFKPNVSTSWWAIEESLVSPHNIEHLVFAGVSLRQCKLRFGPITHFISTWRTVTRKIEPNLRWHRHSPLFHNNNFLSGKNPFYCPQWIKCKVNSFGDIYDDKGLKIISRY